MMERLEREYIDGVGDGLRMAMDAIRRGGGQTRTAKRIETMLWLAREAKNRITYERLREIVSVAVKDVDRSLPPSRAR